MKHHKRPRLSNSTPTSSNSSHSGPEPREDQPPQHPSLCEPPPLPTPLQTNQHLDDRYRHDQDLQRQDHRQPAPSSAQPPHYPPVYPLREPSCGLKRDPVDQLCRPLFTDAPYHSVLGTPLDHPGPHAQHQLPHAQQYHPEQSPMAHLTTLESAIGLDPLAANDPGIPLDDDDLNNTPPRSPRSPIALGKSAIPTRHTTGTGRLFKLPAVMDIMEDLLKNENGIDTKYLHEFPLRNEEQRGTLDFYGHGEAHPSDKNVGWGNTGGFIADAPEAATEERTACNTTPDLHLDPKTVRELVSSYEKNMQNMHPIIPKNDLEHIVNWFLSSYSSAAILPRKIEISVVLCVLALGEICLHKKPLPEISLSRGHFKNNTDIIPGLAYFEIATKILGNQMAGFTEWHIYANLLAGLYYGQLGRPVESHSYIIAASAKAQQLLRSDFGRLTTEVEQQTSAADTRSIIIFWSCVKLESEIITELNLPQSNIMAYEDKFPIPPTNGVIATQVGTRVITSYSSLVYLHKQLNRVHMLLYGDSKEREGYGSLLDILNVLHDMIDPDLWVLPEFRFDPDKDPPATDILDARLRAKYWEIIVSICWPILRLFLNSKFKDANKKSDKDLTDPINQPLDLNNPKVLGYAKRGIRALIESTKAFHGLKELRFITTNVFVTAHTQWGNLIMLAAIYRDDVLGRYVDPVELSVLFQRTIDFLGSVAHWTSALSIDRNLLIGLRDKLDLDPRPSGGAELHLSNTASKLSNTDTEPELTGPGQADP